MTDRIRFHLDENVASAIANALRRRGVDVTTTRDAGLVEASDEDHLQYALAEGRVIFTHDDDYLFIAKQRKHAGIVYCHPAQRSLREILAALLLIADCLTPVDMMNHIEFI
jgi:predicted nuclease of predicted toxin-antitoxin system